MTEPLTQINSDREQDPNQVIKTRVIGTVKWFNIKSGYGFICRDDNKEDVFVHRKAVIITNKKKPIRHIKIGELVEFDVVKSRKGTEASNVSWKEELPEKGIIQSQAKE